MAQLPKEDKKVMKWFETVPLSKDDKKVVEWWWKESDRTIFEHGFTIVKFSFSFDHPSTTQRVHRSFQGILDTGVTIVRCSLLLVLPVQWSW